MPAITAVRTASVRECVLDSGLRILIRELPATPLVSVWCWYRVGSRDESVGRTGLSHWVEHMNFKGTEHIPRDRVKGLIERYGGTWNAYTWIDQTAYFETAPSDALDHLLFVEAERMSHCLYHPDDCEAERTVIISELEGGDNDPEQLLETELTATALRIHPYRHPTIGWLPDLQRLTRDDLYGHYRRYYGPDNATLVVVGDVDADEVLRLADARFHDCPAVAPGPRMRYEEPAQLGERRVTIERPGTAAYLKLAWPAPALTDPDFFPLLVLDAILTGASGLNVWAMHRGSVPQRKARLYRNLVEQRLASSVAGSLLPTEQPFLYAISAAATDGTPLGALEETTLAEIEHVRREGVTSAEVDRARRQLQARFVLENDSVTNLAHQLGFFDVVAGVEFFESLDDRLAAATLTRVCEAAARWLSPNRRTIGWFEPSGDPGQDRR